MAGMEAPRTWTVVTAWLADSNLSDPRGVTRTWSVMVSEGWVRPELCSCDEFAQIVAHEVANPITGPSDARRVTIRLEAAGALTCGALEPDPWANKARIRKGLEPHPWAISPEEVRRTDEYWRGVRDHSDA